MMSTSTETSELGELSPPLPGLLSLNSGLGTAAATGGRSSASASASSVNEGGSSASSAVAIAAIDAAGNGVLVAAASSSDGGSSQQIVYVPGGSSGTAIAIAASPTSSTGTPSDIGAIATAYYFFSREVLSGNLLRWQVDSHFSTVQTGLNAQLPDTSWNLAITGDFNGDGHKDILVHNYEGAGTSTLWHLDNGGNQIVGDAVLNRPLTDTHWAFVGSLQLNDDNKADILLYNRASDQIVVWYTDGAGNVTAEASIGRPVQDPGWQLVATADFNGDGQEDILLHHAESGQLLVWQLQGVEIQSEYLLNRTLDASWTVQGARSGQGDRPADVLLTHSAAGQAVTWSVQAGQVTAEALITGLPNAALSFLL